MNDLLVNKEAIRLKYLNDLGLNAPNLNDLLILDMEDLFEYAPKLQEYVQWLETLVSEKLTEERKPIMSMHDFWEVNYRNIKRPDDAIQKCFGYRVYDEDILDHDEIDAIHKIKKHESRD
jgi:DNA-directed RNA polymerase specialized sigma54-like protein